VVNFEKGRGDFSLPLRNMAQPPHFDIEGSIYFITTRLKERELRFTESEAKTIRKTILDLVSRKEFEVYAYVIMPDHLHILMKPNLKGISKAMQLLKGGSSRQINKGYLWQQGFFDFAVLTERKFKEKFNYIHYNPVKWGLVEKAEDYKFSSAKEYKIKYGEAFYV